MIGGLEILSLNTIETYLHIAHAEALARAPFVLDFQAPDESQAGPRFAKLFRDEIARRRELSR